MAERPTCPICGKRRPERFCPAKGEKICAVCCGTEREVTLDCPADCSFLIAAHRYEAEHRAPLKEADLPFHDVRFPPNLIYDQQPLLSALSQTIAAFFAEHRELTDRDALAAVTSLAETYRTLGSGIYYEKPPTAPVAASLYATLAGFFDDYKKQASERAGILASPAQPVFKDTDLFHLLVFFARICRTRTNDRPRARIFLEFLHTQFPPAARQPEPSRIIVP